MSYPYYDDAPQAKPKSAPVELPGSRLKKQTDPAGYLPDPGLVDAVNVALLLGQPLLLTGAPGTGKTQLAAHLAWKLGLDKPLIYETKSTSAARDLFYGYDALGHFRAVQTGAAQSALGFITWNALGVAILRSHDEDTVKAFLPPKFEHGGPRRSVVLIDEIDKAPRDFPNDLLNEIENQYFRVPELGNDPIRANEALRPVLVLTSNSERNLPDAFLRRCTYFNIPFPNRDRLKEIVQSRVGGFENSESPLLRGALDLFFHLRKPEVDLRKKPATAELIGWLTSLHAMGVQPDAPMTRELAQRSLSALIKRADDQETAERVVKEWA